MALIQTSGIVSHITGSIAGTTFQRSASGLTARSKPIQRKSGSNVQNVRRVNLASLTNEWEKMTIEQRNLWSAQAVYANGTAKTNNQRNYSNTGRTQFIAVNSWLLLYGKVLIYSPTINTPPSPIQPYYTTNYESDNLGRTVGSLDTSSCILVTEVSLPMSEGTITNKTGYRIMQYTQANGTIQDWATAYLNTYGIDLSVGKRYWVRLRVVNFLEGTISAYSEQLIRLTPFTPVGVGSQIIGYSNIIA